MTSRNFKQSMVNQDQEIIFEVVKVSGSWVFPAASSIVEATRGKNMYLRLTDDGRSDIFRLDSVKDGENAGETVFGFVGNGGMDLVELTATTDGTGATTGSWEYAPGEGPAGEAIGNIGKPLQWKGSATVAQLNAGITGIQPGWTYTLTDAGTLTDGSIEVEAGDEVAWTEDDEWFKLGGDSSKITVFKVTFPSGVKTYPNPNEILAAIDAGKFVVIDQPNLGVWEHTEWLFEYANRGAQDYIKFVNGSSTLIATRNNTVADPVWQWDTGDLYDNALSSTSTNAVQNRILERLFNGEGSGEGFKELKYTYSDGLQFVKTHPSTKILSEGFPVDSVDYQLVRTFNGFIYKNITGWKADGTVTVGLWNYDTKQYVAEVTLSSTSDQSPDTIAALTYVNASDEMELHVKGSGTIGAIMGAI